MTAATTAWLTEVRDRAAYNRESMQVTLDLVAAAVEQR
jgi:hypothetical protein